MCSASIKYNASVSMDIMLVRIPCGFRDAGLTLYHRCVPEVINLLLHRSFSSCCSSRASAWSTSRFFLFFIYPRLFLPVILRLRQTLFSSTVLSMPSHISRLFSYLVFPLTHLASPWCVATWSLGYLVTRLRTMTVLSKEKKFKSLTCIFVDFFLL